LKTISKSYSDKDFETLKSTIHKMLPSFTIVGIEDKYLEMAKEIEHEINAPQLKNSIQKIENACNQAMEELNTERNNLNNKKC
jgi:hypothetical protein